MSRGELTILEVAYAAGGEPDHYFVPSVDGREPREGEGAWAAIAAAVADEADVTTARGRFTGTRAAALTELLADAGGRAQALAERVVGGEQSNTSVVLGGRVILKAYRRLEPGLNPDLEVSAFLSDVGFAETPPLAGYLTYEPDEGRSAVAAMLQAFLPASGDAWASMLETLADDAEAGVEMARDMGAVTARLHAALASRPDDEAFPARRATGEEAARWRASAEHQLAQAVTAVGGAAHARMVDLAPAITARFADALGRAASRTTPVSRIHGDYHLGQLLRTSDGGFSVIDFEGEPARPLSERRSPGSPLRDVAGMLRSLDYAARSAASAAGSRGFDPDTWLGRAREAFVAGYGGIRDDDQPLLDAFELEKACYEVRYEANNRPDWLWLPLAAVDRLVAGT